MATGELSLAKLRQRIQGQPLASAPSAAPDATSEEVGVTVEPEVVAVAMEPGMAAIAVEPERVAIAVEPEGPAVDAPQPVVAAVDIDQAARQLSRAVDELVTALLGDASLAEASSADRQLFAKYLTINKVKLENAIAVVRVGGSRPSRSASPLTDRAGFADGDLSHPMPSPPRVVTRRSRRRSPACAGSCETPRWRAGTRAGARTCRAAADARARRPRQM